MIFSLAIRFTHIQNERRENINPTEVGSSFLFSLFFLYKSFTLPNPGSCHHDGLLQGNIQNPDLTLSSHNLLPLLQPELKRESQSHTGAVLLYTTSKGKVITTQVCIQEACFEPLTTNAPDACLFLPFFQMPFS